MVTQNLGPEEEPLFRSITGLRKSLDPKTGFTRYQRSSGQMSNAEWWDNRSSFRQQGSPAAGGPSVPGQPDLSTIQNELDSRLTWLGDQLRADGALTSNAVAQGAEASGQIFGRRAALQSVLIGDVEATISKRSAVRQQIQTQGQVQGQAGPVFPVPTPTFATRRLEQNYLAYQASPIRAPPFPLQSNVGNDSNVFLGVARRLFPRP